MINMRFLNQKCPFAHDRDFRAIMLSSPSIGSFAALQDIFFKSSLGSGETHAKSGDSFKVEHRFYYSSDDFTTSEEDRKACYGRWRGTTASFRYTVFFAELSVKKCHIFLIVLPLMKMARKLYPRLDELSRGKDITYWRTDLKGLIERFKAGENLQGSMTLKSIRYAVYGDNKASGFQVLGSDTASCITLTQIEESLTNKGIRYKPRVVNLLLFNPLAGDRLNLTISRLGHLKFFLNEGTTNFPVLGTILGHLMGLGLFDKTSFPPFNWGDEEEMESES